MTSTALMERAEQAVALTDPAFWEVMQKVVTQGDLSGLSPEHKTKYYRYLCESVGLPPETLPFTYIVVKGGGVKLYANRNATDLLRKIHHVTTTILGRERTTDERGDPVYMVTVRAETPDGRQTEAIGLVPIKGLGGEDYCNALMKCDTKAQRRATLAHTGLSLMDETEAAAIAGARTYTAAEVERADFALPAESAPPLPATAREPVPPPPSTIHQQAELRRLAGAGFPIARELAALGLESVDDVDAEAARDLILAGRAYLRTPAAPAAPATAPPTIEHVVPDLPFVLTAAQISLFWATGAQEGWNKDAKRQVLGELFPERIGQDGTVSIKTLTRAEFDQLIALFEDRLTLRYDGAGKAVLTQAGPPVGEDAEAIPAAV